MLKRFIDDHAIERIDTINKPAKDILNELHRDSNLREKFDALGWLARSVELVSPYLVQDMLRNFKRNVSQPEHRSLRESYIKSYHGSNAATVVLRRLNQILESERIVEVNDGRMQKFTLLLCIMEPLVVNEENAL